MEKSFSLSMDTEHPDLIRATLQTGMTHGRTEIRIAMTLPNALATMPLAALQAEVLRLAIEELQGERAQHLHGQKVLQGAG